MATVQILNSNSSDIEPEVEPVSRTTRKIVAKPRDPLFDAICSVCQVDPATAGASVGNVKAALIKANPPYSAEDVARFSKLWFADKWRTKPPTLWNLKERIGLVRGQNPASDPEAARRAAKRDELRRAGIIV